MKTKPKKSVRKPASKLTAQQAAQKKLREFAAKAASEALGFHLVLDNSGAVMLEFKSGVKRPASAEEQALWRRLLDASALLSGMFATALGAATLYVQVRGGFPGSGLPAKEDKTT